MEMSMIEERSKKVILNHRFFFMGIAILMVILYHIYCVFSDISVLRLFRRGYIGVDIFFFFSGFGLCFSYLRNSLLLFYKNRLLRIMPLYWIWAFIHVIVIYIDTKSYPTLLDLFGIGTTLSYYGIGSIRSNWYLSALMCLYLLFPILFYFIKQKGWYFLIFCLALTAILLYKIPFHWYHSAFVGRIYIFLFGIMAYQYIVNKKHVNHTLFMVTSIITLLGFVFLHYSEHFQFWSTSCICPLIILLLSLVPHKIINNSFITLCGQYSLEIFIANCWVMLLMQYCNMGTIFKMLLYFVCNSIFAFLLYFINRRISTFLSTILLYNK